MWKNSKIQRKWWNHIYKNELNKACFANDAAYSNSKDLAKRTVSDKDRANETARNPKYDIYHWGLGSMVYKFFDKKTGLGASVNEELVQELHKPEGKSMLGLKIIFGL